MQLIDRLYQAWSLAGLEIKGRKESLYREKEYLKASIFQIKIIDKMR